MFNSLRLIVIILLMTVVTGNLFSQITSIRSGNWNTKSTWNTNSVPSSSDEVLIADGHTVTINTNAVCRNLTIGEGGSSASELKFDNNNRSLVVSGAITGYIYISPQTEN